MDIEGFAAETSDTIICEPVNIAKVAEVITLPDYCTSGHNCMTFPISGLWASDATRMCDASLFKQHDM